MNTRLVPIASLYQASQGLFERALSDVSREQALTRTRPDANPLLWIAAHVASTRYALGQMIGLRHERPWGARFDRGSEVGDPSAIPSTSEILLGWKTISVDIASRLPQLGDADLDAQSPRRLPLSDQSVLGALAFLAYHEAYHIGQMAFIRKELGLPGLVG